MTARSLDGDWNLPRVLTLLILLGGIIFQIAMGIQFWLKEREESRRFCRSMVGAPNYDDECKDGMRR